MFQDFNELLSIFNAHSVKYLVVGGDADNAKAVYAALTKFGAPMEGLTREDFTQRGKFFRMGREPVAVDILTEIDGVDFDRAWEKRVEGVIDTASGLKACFISSGDLMAAKTAAGRPQDVADVAALRTAAASRAPQSAPPEPKSGGPRDHTPSKPPGT